MSGWVRGVLIGLIALLGVILSAAAGEGFFHYGGLVIAVLATWVVFRLIGRAYDTPGERTSIVPVPREAGSRLWIGAFSALLGLVGMAVAASAESSGQYLGLFVTLLAWLYVFRLIGASFDR